MKKLFVMILALGLMMGAVSALASIKKSDNGVLLWNPSMPNNSNRDEHSKHGYLLWDAVAHHEIDDYSQSLKYGYYTYREVEDYAGPGGFVAHNSETKRTPYIVVAERGWSDRSSITCEEVSEMYSKEIPAWLKKPFDQVTSIQLIVHRGGYPGALFNFINNGSRNYQFLFYSFQMTGNKEKDLAYMRDTIFDILLERYYNTFSKARFKELKREYRELTGDTRKFLDQKTAVEYVYRYHYKANDNYNF